MIERGDWQVSEVARHAFDLEGKVVGTIGAGRIGVPIWTCHGPPLTLCRLSRFTAPCSI
jgi:hypothetical protein